MSSTVSIDWHAIRENERQACLALRAELAQLRTRQQQLRMRCESVNAAYGRLAVEIPKVGHVVADADSAELGRVAARARADLAGSDAALDRAIDKALQARTSAAASALDWVRRADTETTAALRATPDLDLDTLTGEAGTARSAPDAGAVPSVTADVAGRAASDALAAQADAVIEECRLHCPGADLAELTSLRAEFGTSQDRDAMLIRDLRVRAARTILRVRRDNEFEAERQRLFVLAEDTLPGERATLRRSVADAGPDDLPRLDNEVTAAVGRASAERSQAEAVAALEQALTELHYDVQGGFAALLEPSGWSGSGADAVGQSAAQIPQFAVAASPHSADHGLRVRVGQDQLYLSVVRRSGTAADDAAAADVFVQEKTCRDLVAVTEAAAARGVQIIIGNAQPPGRSAPELAAEYWPSGEQAAASGDERLRAWAALEQRRAAGQRAGRRPAR